MKTWTYITVPNGTVHLHTFGRGRALCGVFLTEDAILGDETVSGIGASCERCSMTAHRQFHASQAVAKADARRKALAPCFCRGPVAEDPCGHGDTSEGCPRHDPNYEA